MMSENLKMKTLLELEQEVALEAAALNKKRKELEKIRQERIEDLCTELEGKCLKRINHKSGQKYYCKISNLSVNKVRTGLLGEAYIIKTDSDGKIEFSLNKKQQIAIQSSELSNLILVEPSEIISELGEFISNAISTIV
ncbi:MAG: hypothetical protein IJ880_08455 [Bacilli bacterium]|nr:hypothetical protein [Bacilli bacterium]